MTDCEIDRALLGILADAVIAEHERLVANGSN